MLAITRSYACLDPHCTHQVIDNAATYVQTRSTRNVDFAFGCPISRKGMEAYWSLLKRGLNGPLRLSRTGQAGISDKSSDSGDFIHYCGGPGGILFNGEPLEPERLFVEIPEQVEGKCTN